MKTCLEWEEFDILLDGWVIPISTNKSFCIENSVFWICGQLIFGCITNKPLTLCSKSNVRRGNSVTLVVGNDFYSTILVHSDTIKRAEGDFRKIKDFKPAKFSLS